MTGSFTPKIWVRSGRSAVLRMPAAEVSTSPSSDAIRRAADLGVTDVMFQVRGRADAFYDSAFEPRAVGLPANFDPLQAAIDFINADKKAAANVFLASSDSSIMRRCIISTCISMRWSPASR